MLFCRSLLPKTRLFLPTVHVYTFPPTRAHQWVCLYRGFPSLECIDYNVIHSNIVREMSTYLHIYISKLQAALDHLLHCLTKFHTTFQRHGLDPEIICQANRNLSSGPVPIRYPYAWRQFLSAMDIFGASSFPISVHKNMKGAFSLPYIIQQIISWAVPISLQGASSSKTSVLIAPISICNNYSMSGVGHSGSW